MGAGDRGDRRRAPNSIVAMADWVTISSLATAGGTLVLAVATFGSVKSANRAARIAELSMLSGLRPLLIPSREDDPVEQVRFGDGRVLTVAGHGASVELADNNLYLAIGVRNGGSGLAVIHGWRAGPGESATAGRPDPSEFRRQQRDIYIPAGDSGFWQGPIRDSDDPAFEPLRAALADKQPLVIDLLYGDHEGGQRTITRFGIREWPDGGGRRAEVLRYWNLDRDEPRER
jgi:hypothetical protein